MFTFPFLLPGFTCLKKKGSSRQERERSKAHLSFRHDASLLNKVGFKTQTVAASKSLTVSTNVKSEQSARPGLLGPGTHVGPVGLSLQS